MILCYRIARGEGIAIRNRWFFKHLNFRATRRSGRIQRLLYVWVTHGNGCYEKQASPLRAVGVLTRARVPASLCSVIRSANGVSSTRLTRSTLMPNTPNAERLGQIYHQAAIFLTMPSLGILPACFLQSPSTTCTYTMMDDHVARMRSRSPYEST